MQSEKKHCRFRDIRKNMQKQKTMYEFKRIDEGSKKLGDPSFDQQVTNALNDGWEIVEMKKYNYMLFFMFDVCYLKREIK